MKIGRTPSDVMIDRCLTAIQTQGYTVEDCLALYPAERSELEPLLHLAQRLKIARGLQPSPLFQAAAPPRLKNRAIARQKTIHRADPLPAFPIRQGGLPRLRFSMLIVGLLIAVLIASMVGTAIVSASSLPGDILYPVKRAQENLQLTLTADQAQRANLHREYANRRMDEALILVDQNRTSSLDLAMSEYEGQIQAELAFLEQDSQLSADEQAGLAKKLLVDVTRQEASLALLSEAAPASQAQIASARSVSQRVYRQADQILNNLGGGKPPAPTLPTDTTTPIRPPKPSPTPTPTSLPSSTSTSTVSQPGAGSRPPTPTPSKPAGTPTKISSPAPGSILKTPTRKPSPTQGESPTPGPKPPNTTVRTSLPTLTPNTGVVATRRVTSTALPSPNRSAGTTPSSPANALPTTTPVVPASSIPGIPTIAPTLKP